MENPLLEFQLFRLLNFLASNVSQMLAGAIELGIGFPLPYYLLLVVGYDPLAGLALIPGTIDHPGRTAGGARVRPRRWPHSTRRRVHRPRRLGCGPRWLPASRPSCR